MLYYEQAIKVHEKGINNYGDKYSFGYEAIGDLHLLISQPNKALEYYELQLEYAEKIRQTEEKQGEALKMRCYKRLVYFYLIQRSYEMAFEWAEKGLEKLTSISCKAELAAFYAEALMCKGAVEAQEVLEHVWRKSCQELMELGEYQLLMSIEAQLISYYYMGNKKEKMKEMAKVYETTFAQAYPEARLEDYMTVKVLAPKRFGEMGWYYLAKGEVFLAEECFKKQWASKPCQHCRSRGGCYKGYLNMARHFEVEKKYNRAIYFYKEVVKGWTLPNHAEANEALKRLLKIPKAERGEEFRRW